MTNATPPPTKSHVGPKALALWIAGWMIAYIIALAFVQIDRVGTPEARASNLQYLWPYWITFAGLWIGLTVLWRMIERFPASLAVSPWRDFKRASITVLSVAIFARIAVLIAHQPSLSDDVYRYIFDGRNLAFGFNPYLVKPADRVDAAQENWPGERQIVDLLVYRELPTPYLPVSHYVFGSVGLWIIDAWSSPQTSALIYRIAFVLIELGLVVLLLHALQRVERSAWWAALYAWHPLAISEIAGSGHQDIIGIALLVAALTVFQSNPQRITGWSALLGLSGMVKPIAIPPAIFMLRDRPWRKWMACVGVGALVSVILAIPLRWMPVPQSEPFKQWSITAREMGDKWAHFAGVYEPVVFVFRKTMPPPNDDRAHGWNLVQEKRARWVCMALLAGVFIVISLARMDVWKSTAAFMLALVLLSSTAHPWYLLWALALCPMAISRTMWVASLTLPWGYVVFTTGKGHCGGEEWTAPTSTIALAYAPIFFALAWDLLECRRRLRLRTAANPGAAQLQRISSNQ